MKTLLYGASGILFGAGIVSLMLRAEGDKLVNLFFAGITIVAWLLMLYLATK